VKLNKTPLFPTRAEFVGVNILQGDNTSTSSKNAMIKSLTRPERFGDFSMIIRFIGFYRKWIPNYENRISPWRQIMKQRPNPGNIDKEAEVTLLREQWKEVQEELLEELKGEILKGPLLQRPNSYRRFFLKLD
jgi:hypothetical protein